MARSTNLYGLDDKVSPKRNIDFTYLDTKKFKVTMDARGGTVKYNTSTIGVKHLQKFSTSYEFRNYCALPTREGYTFEGWFTSPTGGTQITEDTVYNWTTDITLYAHWHKNAASVTTVPTEKNLTYNGKAQELINAGTASDSGSMRYSLDSENWSADIPTGTNAGSYTVYYKAVEEGADDSEVGQISVNIAKATPTVTAPTAKTLTYNGSAQVLINAGSTTGGTMQYSLTQNGTYSATIPTGTNAGSYTVYYKVVGNSNYNDNNGGNIPVTINKRTVTATIELPSDTGFDYTYDGTAKTPTVVLKDDNGNTIPESEYTVKYENNTNAGTATIKITNKDGGNYVVSGETTFGIPKRTVTAPTIELPSNTDFDYTYDGTAKTPTVILKDDNGNTIPESEYNVTYTNNTDAGTATITITNKDGGNYVVSGETTFKINRADYNTATVALSDWIYKENPEDNTPVVSGLPEEVQNANPEITYEYAPKGTNNWSPEVPVQEGEYVVRATIAQTANYNSQTATADFEIKLKEGFAHIDKTPRQAENGKLFAGYFTDSTCQTAYLGDDVAYSKYVDAETYLNLTNRVNASVSADGKKADLTFSVLAPDTNFQNVRFEIKVAGKTKKVQIDRLVKTDEGCQAIYTLKGVLKKYFGKEITITPTWKTLDGTTVTGTPTTYTITP